MTDDGVKQVTAVGTLRRSGADDVLDLLDAVAAAVAAETAVVIDRFRRSGSGPAALAPRHRPGKQSVDVRQLVDGIERIAGDGQRLVGAPKQLGGDRLVIDHQVELAVQLHPAGQSPDTATGAARCHLAIGVAAALEEQLRPDIDAAESVTAVVEIDGRIRIVSGQYVGEPVGVSGLHRGQGGSVVGPGVGVVGAGVPLRIACLIRRLLPRAIRLLRPSPHSPLLSLLQRRQSARQPGQVGLVCCRL